MKKIILLVGILIASVAFVGHSEAAMLDAYVTGDNVLWSWEGDHWQLLTSNWMAPYHHQGPENMGETVDLYFAVKDLGGSSAGLLGSMTISEGVFKETGENKFLTDTTNWWVYKHSGWTGDPAFDPTGLSYIVPNSYGTNNTPGTAWYVANGNKPLADIDNDAQWIWTNNKQGDDYAVFHTKYTVVPEPMSLSLLGIGLLGAIGAGFRKRK